MHTDYTLSLSNHAMHMAPR